MLQAFHDAIFWIKRLKLSFIIQFRVQSSPCSAFPRHLYLTFPRAAICRLALWNSLLPIVSSCPPETPVGQEINQDAAFAHQRNAMDVIPLRRTFKLHDFVDTAWAPRDDKGNILKGSKPRLPGGREGQTTGSPSVHRDFCRASGVSPMPFSPPPS